MSNALYATIAQTATSQAATQATSQASQAPGELGPVAAFAVCAGCIALVVWIVRRIATPEKLSLRRCPGRPNRLEMWHLVVVFVAFYLPKLVVASAEGGQVGVRAGLVAGMIAQLAAIATSLAIAARTFRHGLPRGLGLSMRHSLWDTVRGVVGYLTIMPICIGLFLLVGWLFKRTAADEHPLLVLLGEGGLSVGWQVLIVVSAVVLAPVAEELMFRGLLQSALRRAGAGPWLAIACASVVFAGSHFTQPKDMPALAALAVALGYNYERTGRLYPSMLMHAVFNAVSISDLLIATRGA
jgi:membrane protease YdiL (CAAX protease family)